MREPEVDDLSPNFAIAILIRVILAVKFSRLNFCGFPRHNTLKWLPCLDWVHCVKGITLMPFFSISLFFKFLILIRVSAVKESHLPKFLRVLWLQSEIHEKSFDLSVFHFSRRCYNFSRRYYSFSFLYCDLIGSISLQRSDDSFEKLCDLPMQFAYSISFAERILTFVWESSSPKRVWETRSENFGLL